MPSDTETTDQQDQRDADPQADESTEALGEAGKAALERERADRKAAEKRAREAEKRLADLDADARRKADEEAAEQGKWQDLATQREAALTETTTERDSLKAEVETLRAHVTADIDAALKDEAFKPFLRFDPGPDAPIAARLKWLAEAKAGLADLPKATTSPIGNGPNPKAANGHRDLEAAARAARPNYTI